MARRLLHEVDMVADDLTLVVAGGCGPFWQRAVKFNKAAEFCGYVLGLTDLDNHPCAAGLITEKLPEPLHPRFALRIQVRELESWLLADAAAWAAYLNVSPAIVPTDPDGLEDPKRELVNLVRRCRKKSLREDIVPDLGAPRLVGPGYTTRIGEFIWQHWQPTRAVERSPSLRRSVEALRRIAQAPEPV